MGGQGQAPADHRSQFRDSKGMRSGNIAVATLARGWGVGEPVAINPHSDERGDS